jgi:adenine C2-methylase RlmN of 23S rRNA A2503 and tRNA A37
MLKTPISHVFKTISSSYEPSTNFLIRYGKGVIETRYVRKETRKQRFENLRPQEAPIEAPLKAPLEQGLNTGYIACYVSSHNGCSMGCRFCHLTQNKDTFMKHVDIPTYLLQIETVLRHYNKVTSEEEPLETREEIATSGRCNINFMSKGDALNCIKV